MNVKNLQSTEQGKLDLYKVNFKWTVSLTENNREAYVLSRNLQDVKDLIPEIEPATDSEATSFDTSIERLVTIGTYIRG